MTDGRFDILKYATVIPMQKQVCQVFGNLLEGELVAREVDIYEHFITGTGHGQPLGVLRWVYTHFIERQHTGFVYISDCINMVNAFMTKGKYGWWFFSPTAYAQFGRDVDCDFHAVDIERKLLFGMPICIHRYSPELGQRGDVILANFSNYVVGRYKSPPSQYPEDSTSDGILYDGYPANPTTAPIGNAENFKYNFVALSDAQ